MLQHVTHPVPPSKLEDCLDFYRLLGFEPVPVPEGIAGRARWLQHGAGQIHLMLDDHAGPRPGHVGLIVEDYEQTIAALRRRGHEIEPRQPHWGSPRAYVHDPAGNLVEIMAFGPPPAPEAPPA